MEPNLLKRLGQNDPLGSRFWGCGVERHTPKPSRLPAPAWVFLGWLGGILTMCWLMPAIRN